MSKHKYKVQNGWTIEKMKLRIMEKNNGNISMSEDTNSCLYRGPNGNQCPAGCFIDDADYKPEFENKQARTLPIEIINKFPISIIGISVMQDIHDGAELDMDVRDLLCKWIDENVTE